MFEIQVRMVSPMSHDRDPDSALARFLAAIGYIKPTMGENVEEARHSVGFRLFKECFLAHPDKMWSAEEMIVHLDTSKPTLYRYLNKLKALDLLEESHEGITKRYRLRYGNLRKAWTFVEANVNIAMENYRKMVEHIMELMEG